MTETTVIPPRASRKLRNDIIKEKAPHNVEGWIALGGGVAAAAATAGFVYLAVWSFTAGGGWIVLGIFSCGWALAALGIFGDQVGRAIGSL